MTVLLCRIKAFMSYRDSFYTVSCLLPPHSEMPFWYASHFSPLPQDFIVYFLAHSFRDPKHQLADAYEPKGTSHRQVLQPGTDRAERAALGDDTSRQPKP